MVFHRHEMLSPAELIPDEYAGLIEAWRRRPEAAA
jgi:hypothetical protein